jgi:hypothetical protein
MFGGGSAPSIDAGLGSGGGKGRSGGSTATGGDIGAGGGAGAHSTGGSSSTTFPQTMKVDWVRVYQPTDAG